MARRPKGALVAWWSEKGEDVPAGGDLKFGWDKHSCDGSLLYGALAAKRMAIDINQPNGVTYCAPSLAEELKARGYDLTTLRFSIERLTEGGSQ